MPDPVHTRGVACQEQGATLRVSAKCITLASDTRDEPPGSITQSILIWSLLHREHGLWAPAHKAVRGRPSWPCGSNLA
jgi:hypothetical protein